MRPKLLIGGPSLPRRDALRNDPDKGLGRGSGPGYEGLGNDRTATLERDPGRGFGPTRSPRSGFVAARCNEPAPDPESASANAGIAPRSDSGPGHGRSYLRGLSRRLALGGNTFA